MSSFSLLGGPLHRLGVRLGLVRDGADTLRVGLAIGAVLWCVLAALAVAQGRGRELFSLSVVGVHVRLLVAIPLFFLCETWLDPRMTSFVATLGRSEILPDSQRPLLEATIRRTTRRTDSWLPESLCLAAAVLMSVGSAQLNLSGATSSFDPTRTVNGVSWAAQWYWVVCLPCFRFLMLRSLWRLVVWTLFLRQVASYRLHLVPTHPDGAAGLGFLEVVHQHFAPLILALSSLQAAALAEELSTGVSPFDAVYSSMAVVMIVEAVLFLGPLFIFTRQLWMCRVNGQCDYMDFAEHYVHTFDRKWLRGGSLPDEPLLGTSDLQSLADLNTSVSIVRGMRLVPLSPALLMNLACAAALPALPLLLFRYPLAELAQRLFSTLVGL